MPPHNHLLLTKKGDSIHFTGPSLDEGALPAVIYFALSAQQSLFEDPFNQPAARLSEQGIRVFSWDLPYHGPGLDPRNAMHQWAHAFIHNPGFISDFLDTSQQNVDFLIDQGHIDPKHMGIAGLSRGGFIAAHMSAQDSRFKTLLGFAPLTQPQPLEELKAYDGVSLERISLTSLVHSLIHTSLRFYIGNHDNRVGTDACYQFIHLLTETAIQNGIRSPSVELRIYPSIGYKGHGTPPSIFHEGADWMKQQLIDLLRN